MRVSLFCYVLFLIFGCHLVEGNQRILAESTPSSTRWQFDQFSTQVEQNMQTIVFPNKQLLFVQTLVDENEKKSIILQKYERDETKIGNELKFGDLNTECIRPKVTLIKNIGFALSWIEKKTGTTKLYIQIINFDLNPITQKYEINDIHLEVHWDFVSEFHYIEYINETKLLILYKGPNKTKFWSGTIYDYQDNTRTSDISLIFSKQVSIAVNQLQVIVLIQKVDDSYNNQVTILNQDGQIQRTFKLYQYYYDTSFQPKIAALQNNNFIVVQPYYDWITLYVYDNRFQTIINNNLNSYYSYGKPADYATAYPSWEYYGYFRNGLIQLQALEDSFVIVGVDIYNFMFNLIHLKNKNLEFIQQRVINYEDLNIYRYSIQSTGTNSIFVQWIDGMPETLLPQYKQNLYLSELNLQLNIDDCGANCDTCQNGLCKECLQNFSLVNNVCQPQCIQNCQKCSNQIACELCQDGFVLTNKLQCIENNSNGLSNREFRVSLSETTYKVNSKFTLLPDRRVIIIYQEENQEQKFLQIKVLNAIGQTILSQQLDGEDVLNFDFFQKENVLHLYLQKKISNKIGFIYFQLQLSDLQQIKQIQLEKYESESLYSIPYQTTVFKVLDTNYFFTIFVQGGFQNYYYQRILSFTYEYSGFLKNQYFYGEIYVGNIFYYQRKKIFDAVVDGLGKINVLLTRECEAQLYILDQEGRIINQKYQSYSNYWGCIYLQNPSISVVPITNQLMIVVQDLNNQLFIFNWQEDVLYTSQFNQKQSNPQLKALSSNSFILIYEEYHLDGNFKTLNYLHQENGIIKNKQILNQNSIQPGFVEIESYDSNYLFFLMIAFKNSGNLSTNQIYLQQIFIKEDQLVGLINMCEENCSQCDVNLKCSECKANYVLDTQNMCQLVCLDNCSYCEKANQCEICMTGYQLNNDRQCMQAQINSISILDNHQNRIESNSQIAVAKNGNMIVTWMEYDATQNTYFSFFKVFNSHGEQIKSDYLEWDALLPKVKAFGEYFVLSVLRYREIILNIMDLNGNFIIYWRQVYYYTDDMDYNEINQFQYDIATNGQSHIFLAVQRKISYDNFRVSLIRFSFIQLRQEIRQEIIKEFDTYSQRIKNLEIQVNTNFIYYQFQRFQINPYGFNQATTIFAQVNYNLEDYQTSEIGWESFYTILTSQTKIQIIKYEKDFEIKFFQYNSQIYGQLIQTGMIIDSIKAASYQDQIVILWIGYETDQRKMFIQSFQMNGTVLSTAIQLPVFSNYPSNPEIGCLENGDTIITWQEQGTSEYTIYAVKFNKHLQLIPLTSVTCMQNCETCMTTTSCSRCSQSYYFDGIKCKLSCDSYCQLCTVKNTCDICQPGYYLQDRYCYYDEKMIEEQRITKIEDYQLTRISITSFSDSSFVVVWNNKLNSIQTLYFQFYDNNKQKSGDVRPIVSQNDRQYAQTVTLANDQFAVVWFEGDCNIQCRLVLQIYNKELIEQIPEVTIDNLALPNVYDQKPVVLKRQDNRLIIAYISYRDLQTYGYFAIYQIDNLVLLNPQVIETTNRVDNLDIIIYNPQIYIILYVCDGKQLKGLRVEKDVGESNKIIYESGNALYTPTHVVNSCGNIVLAWSESILENYQYIKQILVGSFDSYLNQVFGNMNIQRYYMEQQENPILMGNTECQSFSVFSKSSEFLTQTRKRIMVHRFNDNYDGSQTFYLIRSFSFEHKYFQIEQIQHQDYILVEVGLSSEIQSTIFIMRIDGYGNQIKLNEIVCFQYCQECNNSHSCLKCQDGYWMYNQKCIKSCPNHVDYCDEYGKLICSKEFQLNKFNECVSLDPELTQQLINTQQFGSQYNQKIATLSNGNSVVVWNSNQQSVNGVSIYMQLFDTSFSKIGAETMITKDSIGVQENPNVAALQNNEFIVIWKDSNPANILRILMQKFSINFERIGNEIVVYDSTTSDMLINNLNLIYDYSTYQILQLSNNNVAVVLGMRSITNQIQIRMKLYDQDLIEFKSILIGSAWCCPYQLIQMTQIDSSLYILWRNNNNKLQIVTISSEGDIINGKEFEIYTDYYTITKNELNQLVIAWSNYQSAQIQRFNQQLEEIGDQITINADSMIEQISLCQVQEGIILAFKYKKQTPYYETQSIQAEFFDNYLVSSKSLTKQLNDYNGYIENIQITYNGNHQFIVTWTQRVYSIDDYFRKSDRDASDSGLYAKRLDTNGNVLKISNVICQTNCNKCSKQNLCESCNVGFQFDSTKSICTSPCPLNCLECYNDWFRPNQCYRCQLGYSINYQGQCEKIVIQDKQMLYQIGVDQNYEIQDLVTLQNGNIVVTYYKNRKDIYFKIINNQGQVIMNDQYICCTDGNEQLMRIAALSNGNFAIINRSFFTNSNNQIRLHIYDQNGREIRNQPIITFALWNYYYWWYQPSYNYNLLAIKSLSDGGFAITYMNDNNGYQFTNPKIYLRIYNNKFYQVSPDITLNDKYLEDYYWEWWNNNNLVSILETETHLVVTNNYQNNYWWDYRFNIVQVNLIDKIDYSTTRQYINFGEIYERTGLWTWWWYDSSAQIYQIKNDEFIIFKIFPRGILRFDFDKEFKLTKYNNFAQNQLASFWDQTCPACCVTCWNYNKIQILQLDRSFVLNYLTNYKNPNYSSNIIKLLPFNFNMEQLSSIKEVKFYQNNKWYSQQRNGIIKKYLNNNILVMSVIQLDMPTNNLHILFERQDYKCNKLQMWEQICVQNCLTCVNSQNSNQQCLSCESNYYLDDQQQCQLICQFDHCLSCENSGTKQQYCNVCEEGYRIKDNSQCVQKDPDTIYEKQIGTSIEKEYILPRVKALSDGTILVVTLQQQKDQMVVYGQIHLQNGENSSEIVILAQNINIGYFDFSISSQGEILLVWVDQTNLIQIKAQKYDKTLQKVGSEFIVYDQAIEWRGIQFVTVEYLVNDEVGFILFGYNEIYIKKYDINNNGSQLEYVGYFYQDYWGWFWQWQADNDFKYPYYLEYWLKKEPSLVSTTDFIFVVYQENQRIVLTAFQYNLCRYTNYNFDSVIPIQPSAAKLENGNIVVIWIDKIQSNSQLSNLKEIKSYQQHAIAYAIFDPYLISVKYNFFGIDYVRELKPDIAAIPNGFAISFSGISEQNFRNIDLRVVYFDLNGNQQSGFIPISFYTQQLLNPTISAFLDGSIIVTWNEGQQIYAQKLNRNGIIQPFNSILCSQYCRKCTQQYSCNECFDGYVLNGNNQCQPICLIPNCYSCTYWSDRCVSCNKGYYLDEMNNGCHIIDQSLIQEHLLQDNIQSGQSTTLIVENNQGQIIHLWLNYESKQLFAQSLTNDGSLILDPQPIMSLEYSSYDAFTAAYHKESNQLVVLLANYDSQKIVYIKDNFELNPNIIKLDDLLKSEFLYVQLQNIKLYTFYGGIILNVSGDRKVIVGQFSPNPYIRVCNVPELIVLDLQGNQVVPSIIFSTQDNKLQNLFLNQYNDCYKWNVNDILIDDYIYVILSDYNYGSLWILNYDFNGQKQQERNLKDFLPYYWNQCAIKKFQGELYIFAMPNRFIKMSPLLDVIQNEEVPMLDLYYFQNPQIVRITYSQISYIFMQQLFQTRRYKLVIYDYQMKFIVFQELISPTSLFQGSFTYIKQQNDDLLFSWLEQGLNNDNYGKSMILRVGLQGQRLKFQEFSCLPVCLSCTAIIRCQSCIENYELVNQKCLPICSNNCISCSQPFTCDVCQADYYNDDSQNCQSLIGQPIEIKIDDTFNYAENLPRVAQFSNGGCVIVWQSELQDGSGFGVYARLMNSEGVAVNQIIQVNVNTKNSQFLPDVTILPNNNIIIIWADGDINNESELYFQIFDQELNRIGTPTLVDNLYIQYLQYYDRPFVVQGLSNNQFVIAWILNSNSQRSIFVSLFDTNGVLKKSNQIINFDSNNEVVINSNGINFVIVYKQGGQLATTFYNFEGVEQASRTYPIYGISSPSITSNSKQEYIICWTENDRIKYSLFDNNLNQQGLILEAEYLNTKPDNLDITAFSSGFAIVWQNWDLVSTRDRKLRLQIFDINGAPQSTSIEVNTITTYPEYPQISTLNNDKFVIIWDGQKQKSDDKKGIFMMKFGSNGSKELIDGIVCPNKCKSCSSITTCITCSTGYLLSDGLCKPECPSNCSQCSMPHFCDLCQDGFKLDPSGLCSAITSNILPEDPLLTTPFDELPSFSSTTTIGQNDVLIYSGTVAFENDSYLLKANLQLIAGANQHEFSYSIKLLSLKSQVLQSDVLIRNDNSIQIYWVELIEKEILLIKVITISYELVIVEYEKQIDSIPYTQYQRDIHEDFVTYLFYQNSTYYVIFSHYSQLLKYEVYQYRISYDYQRVSNPERILEIQRQIRYDQICFTQDQIVIIEMNQYYLLRSYSYSIDFTNVVITENQMSMQVTIYVQSFTIKRLHNSNFVISWKAGSTQSQTSKNQIYYTILNSNLQKFTDFQLVTNSNGILENPQIIVLQSRFAIIWNNYISITYSQLSISFYEESGVFISETKQVNTISNNIKLYFARVINGNQIAINWIASYTTVTLKIKYQYYYLRITDQNVLLPSPTLICMKECGSCQNEYTCQTCITDYALNPNTFKCEAQCPQTCLKCSSPTICQECKEGYKLSDKNQCEKNICKENCLLCNAFQECLQCSKNFYLNTQHMTECIGTCGPKCAVCTSPPVCNQCEDSYYWSQINTECVPFETVIIEKTKSNPLIATFPNGDYIELWSEEGPDAGVYFQLFRKSGQKVGSKTKVNMDELGMRRLLQSQIQKQVKTLFSDIATFDQDFVILWVDQIVGDMKVKLKKFDTNGQAMGKEVQIAEIPKQDLNSIAAPCIIKKTTNNNFVIGFFNQVEQSINKTATMVLQSYNQTMQPIGQIQILDNADISKPPMISSDEDGVISITFSSEGATFLAQISTQGDIIRPPKKVDDGKAFKSTNLKNKFIVFIFEGVSTNVSPPQYILSYQMMNLDDMLSEPKIFASPQYGEEHPYITAFGYGFIIAWRTVDKSLKSQDIMFQIFDGDGLQISNQTQVKRQGLYPKNPSIQILNDEEFYITWTATNNNNQDNFYLQQFNKADLIIQNQNNQEIQQSIICSLNCLSCLSNTICENCASGYYVENNFCQIDCGIDCLSCSTPNKCDECMLGYEVSLNHTCVQIQCENGYTLSDNMECIPTCSEYCNQCQSYDKCVQCEPDYNLFKGRCFKLNQQVDEVNADELPYYYIILICLAAICLLGFITYVIWKFKSTNPVQLERSQQRQVIDERENTVFDSRIN